MPKIENDEYLTSEEVKIKYDQLNEVLLGSFRKIFFKSYMDNIVKGNIIHIMMTKPANIDYEILIFNHYLGFMKYLLS